MQNFILPVVYVAEQTGLSLTQSETRKTGFLARWPYCTRVIFYVRRIGCISTNIEFTVP